MFGLLRKGILYLAEKRYVRSAIESGADLSAFKEKPTPQIICGVFAIIFSYVIGWPAVAVLGIVSLKLENPWFVTIGGPLVYGLSHLVFLLGMYLAGGVYTLIFLRWLTRITMEKLLVWVER